MADKSVSEGSKTPFTKEFDELAEGRLKDYRVPGLAIGVVDGDNEYSTAYGMAVLPSTKATPSTLWPMASTSKAFTAAAIGILLQKHPRLNWQTPISSILPEDFILADSTTTSLVSIEDALSHRTGLPRHDTAVGLVDKDGKHPSLKQTVQLLRYLPANAPVRTKYEYANLPFIVAAHMIEVLSSKTFPAYMKENILQPLGMEHTYLRRADAETSGATFAQGYRYLEGDKFGAIGDMCLDDFDGAGSQISCIQDYLKWVKALLSCKKPITPELRKELFTPRINIDDGFDRNDAFTGPLFYAVGWVTGIYRGYRFWTHGGGSFAFGANVVVIPDLNWASVAAGNTAGSANSMEESLQWWLVDEKLGIPREERFDYLSKYKKEQEEETGKYDSLKDKYFPTIPKPPIPHSRPIEDYAGTYTHPAYGDLAIELSSYKSISNIVPSKQILTVIHADHSFKITMQFHHVSGEYFLIDWDSLVNPGCFAKSRRPALFRVASDGVVKSVGIRMEDGMRGEWEEELIWFERIV